MPIDIQEENMNDKEIAHIEGLLNRDSVGYFKTLGLIFMIVLVFVNVVWFITSNSEAVTEEEKKFSFPNFLLASFVTVLFIMALTIYGKKRFSSRFKQDIKRKKKLIITTLIHRKQYVPFHKKCYFHVDYPGVNSFPVTADDYNFFEVGDIIHIEISKYSKTYLGYF